MKRIILNVNEMSCMHCISAIKSALEKLDGIQDIDINLEEKTVTVEYKEESTSEIKIKETIEEQGYDVEPVVSQGD